MPISKTTPEITNQTNKWAKTSLVFDVHKNEKKKNEKFIYELDILPGE